MTYPQTKTVCQLDAQGFYLGTTEADLSPLEAEQGVYLLPANCVDAMSPEQKDGYLAQWQDGEWQYVVVSNKEEIVTEKVLNPEAQKAEQQAEMWERIKQKRYENGLGGVYIERLGKWFQTGEEEKIKYLGLDKVIDNLNDIDWKCADNSFVKINRTLLDEIFLQMVATENADHINAEKHRLQMLETENPLEYDFSGGWSPTYSGEES